MVHCQKIHSHGNILYVQDGRFSITSICLKSGYERKFQKPELNTRPDTKIQITKHSQVIENHGTKICLAKSANAIGRSCVIFNTNQGKYPAHFTFELLIVSDCGLVLPPLSVITTITFAAPKTLFWKGAHMLR